MDNNISSCSNQPLPVMTIESLKEAIDKISKLPPCPVNAKCSEDTFNYIKIATQKELKTIFSKSGIGIGFGINVFKTNIIATGYLEIEYSDKSTKIIKLF